jgi:hypothetical protein
MRQVIDNLTLRNTTGLGSRSIKAGAVVAFVAAVLLSLSATQSEARRAGGTQAKTNDHVIEAIQNQSRVHFLEIHNAVVKELLPDDNRGRRHQKWIVEIEDGSQILAVYNIDLAPRVPMNVGDLMTLGGEFIYDNGGGLIHWLHADPRNRRPDGYVEINGQRYGDLH